MTLNLTLVLTLAPPVTFSLTRPTLANIGIYPIKEDKDHYALVADNSCIPIQGIGIV
jgi:hypothetical protein